LNFCHKAEHFQSKILNEDVELLKPGILFGKKNNLPSKKFVKVKTAI
jgi:hypothetical protein